MGLKYNNERAIETINFLIDNGMVWARLDDLASKYYLTRKFLKQEMDNYLHELSLNDPENELLIRYNIALEEKTKNKRPNSRAGVINELLSLDEKDYERYFSSLPKYSLDLRLKVISELLQDTSGVYDIKQIRSLANALDIFIKNSSVNDTKQKVKSDRFTEIVDYYINSNDVLINKPLLFQMGFTPERFKLKLDSIKKSIDDGSNEFDEDTKRNYLVLMQQMQSRKTTVAKILDEVANNIRTGLKKANGNVENYTRFDFFEARYNISLDDLVKVGRSLARDGVVSQTNYRMVEQFNTRANFHAVKVTPSYRFYLAGRVMTASEHEAVCNYMTNKGYPLEADIYDAVVREYYSGRISLNVMNK